jgi:hypothetical protein
MLGVRLVVPLSAGGANRSAEGQVFRFGQRPQMFEVSIELARVPGDKDRLDVGEVRHLTGRKWCGTLEGIHLDLYVTHQSRLGQHLELPP